MPHRTNSLGQPIGHDVPGWTARPRPSTEPIEGRFCRVEKLDPAAHAADLFAGNRMDFEGRNWTYLAYGPFERFDDYRAWLESAAAGDDPLFHTIVDRASGKAIGVASFLRIDPPNGVIEVGHINYSPLLQKRPHASEAMYLMMARVFDELGYRRYEWKCDALNGPSRAAAARYGFTFEGIFRQAVIYKGRNRDTAWFSITNKEWPAVKRGFQAWLEPANFDAQGHQKKKLSDLIASAKRA